MKKYKLLTLSLVLMLILSFSSCSNKEPKEEAKSTSKTEEKATEKETQKATEKDSKTSKEEQTTTKKKEDVATEVNLYTTRHYESDDALYKKFEEETGIKVNVVKEKKAGALIEKIKSQGDSVQADVFITADAGNLAKAKKAGILENISSEILNKNIPEKYRDTDNNWFGLTKRARIMLYSKERVSEDDLKGLDYSRLATDEKWNKKLLVRSSSNIYNQSLVASFIEILGEDEASKWVEGIANQMARTPEGNDRDQALAIKNKEGDIAISNSYYFGKLVNDKDPDSKYAGVADVVDIYFPNQDKNGVHVNISGAGVIKNAPHKEAAIKLIEFLSQAPQQEQFSATNYEFPVNPEAKTSDLLQSWLDKQGITELNEQKINLSSLGDNNAKALEIMTLKNWDKQ